MISLVVGRGPQRQPAHVLWPVTVEVGVVAGGRRRRRRDHLAGAREGGVAVGGATAVAGSGSRLLQVNPQTVDLSAGRGEVALQLQLALA